MKNSFFTILLCVALVAIALGWCVDRYGYRNSVNNPDEFVDIGFALGTASESTLIYFMHDENNFPIDSNRFSHVRERELISNVLSMAAVHKTITTVRQGNPNNSIPEWRAVNACDLAARSLRLLKVNEVRDFQIIFENHGWDAEYVEAYKSENGSLAGDLVAFVELAIRQNEEHAQIYDE